MGRKHKQGFHQPVVVRKDAHIVDVYEETPKGGPICIRNSVITIPHRLRDTYLDRQDQPNITKCVLYAKKSEHMNDETILTQLREEPPKNESPLWRKLTINTLSRTRLPTHLSEITPVVLIGKTDYVDIVEGSRYEKYIKAHPLVG